MKRLFAVLTLVFSSTAFSAGPGGAPWISSYNDTVIDKRDVTVLYPSNAQQAIAMIQKYRALKKKIRIIGKKHSTSSTILSDDGVYLSTVDLKKIGPIDHRGGETFITVEPGVELGTLSDYLARKGYSLGFAYPQFRGLSIGGLTATGSMGSSLIHPAVSSQLIEEIDLITAQTTKFDEIVKLRKGSGDMFSAATVSLGSMGLAVSLKIKIFPEFNLEMKSTVVDYKDLFREPGKVTWSTAGEPTPDTSMIAVFFNTGKVVRMEGRKTTAAAMPGAEFTPFGVGAGITDASHAAVAALEKAHNDLSVARKFEAGRVDRFEKEPQFVTLNSDGQYVPSSRVVGPSGKMTLGRGTELRLPYIANDYAFSFPDRQSFEIVKAIEDFAKAKNFNFPITGPYFRFSHSSPGSSLMSHMERPGGTRELMVMAQFIEYKPWGEDTRAVTEHDRIREELFDLLLKKFQVRLHFGKNNDSMFDRAAALLPTDKNAERFVQTVQQTDPEGIFDSDFMRTKILPRAGLRPKVQ